MYVEMLYPSFALVGLTFLVWMHMYYVRLTQMHKHRLDPQDMTPFNRNLPPRIITSGDNLRNLFEMPVLFYFATAVIFLTGVDDRALLAMCWVFVALRVAHSVIHVTYNRVLHRFVIYAISSLVLFAIWVRAALIVIHSASTPGANPV